MTSTALSRKSGQASVVSTHTFRKSDNVGSVGDLKSPSNVNVLLGDIEVLESSDSEDEDEQDLMDKRDREMDKKGDSGLLLKIRARHM